MFLFNIMLTHIYSLFISYIYFQAFQVKHIDVKTCQ